MIGKRRLAQAAIVLALIAPQPASANEATVATAVGVVTFKNCIEQHCISGELVVRADRVGSQLVAGVFECTVQATAAAVSVPLAASVTIEACSVGGVSAPLTPGARPGAVATATGVVGVLGPNSLKACIGGLASFAETIFGPLTVPGGDCDYPLEFEF